MDSASKAPRILTAALALTLALPLATGASMNPATTLLVGAIASAVLCGLAVWAGRRSLGASVMWACGAGAALALWLTISASRSGDPAVSFMGTVSQHTGAALWLLIATWTFAATSLADRRALRDMLSIVSLSGALFAILGVGEALTSGDRGWGSAAGPFENSSSLGTFLAVALLAAFAWAVSERRQRLRVTAIVCVALMIVGMFAAESRAGMAGALVGLVIVALVWLNPPGRVQQVLFALGLPAAGIGVTALLVAAATGNVGVGAGRLVASLGTSRDAIWRSAAAQFFKEPLLGSGPEQFSAWIAWSFRDGLLRYNGTYDPHNAILGIALGGGVIALLAWAFFAGATTWAQLGVLRRTGRPKVLIPIIALPSALMASALFAWLTPAAAVAAAALTGALFAADVPTDTGDGVDTSGARRRAVTPMVASAAVLALASAVVVVLAAPMTLAELQHSRIEPPGTPAAYVAIYQRWADPSYASLAIDSSFATQGDAAAVSSALGVPRRSVAWHVDLALREIFLAQDALAADPAAWDRFAAAIETGAEADPTSPLWYTIGAAQADAEGRTAERVDYAWRALALELAAEERAYLEGLVAKE